MRVSSVWRGGTCFAVLIALAGARCAASSSGSKVGGAAGSNGMDAAGGTTAGSGDAKSEATTEGGLPSSDGGGAGGAAGAPVAGGAATATVDAGGRDGGSASSGCAGKTYKLCEDFESGTVGMIPDAWTVLRGYATTRGGPVLANDAAHSGSMSLKSDGMVTGMDRVQRSLSSIGATATKHWGRLFYKVGTPAPKPNTGVIHITMAALQGTTENRVVDTVVAMSGAHQWLFNIPDDSCCTASPYDWTFDTAWHCAEWYIDVATSSFRFFSDGQEVTQLAFTNNAGARMSDYTSIGLGTIYYQMPPAPIIMWFDDLAIDDNRVGCE